MSGHNYSSEIKQTATSIDLSIRNGLTQTGINITDKTINVKADNFTIKNNAGNKVLGTDANGNLEVTGTVKAMNLFRSVALVSKDGTLAQPRIVVFDTSGNTNIWVYIKQTFSYGGKSYTKGTYHTVAEIGNSFVPDNYYDYCIVCTYMADEVIATYKSTSVGDVSVVLPRCQDFGGKTVIVRNDIGAATTPNFKAIVSQVADGSQAFSSVMLTMNGFNIVSGNSQSSVIIDEGKTFIFYSTGSRWETLTRW